MDKLSFRDLAYRTVAVVAALAMLRFAGDPTGVRFAVVALGVVVVGYFVPAAIVAYQSYRNTHRPPSE